jgi:N-formylglutamate amidohydrolase
MTDEAAPVFAEPFRLVHPEGGPAAVLFNSPHSGRNYPDFFVQSSRLDRLGLRRSEDMEVDCLLEDAVSVGASLFTVDFPRAYCDVNREPYELDPKMFSTRLPAYANTRSLRVASGLGTIPRTVGDNQEIYPGPIPFEEAFNRIETLYKPYHRALARALTTAHRRHGFALLVDCHSMPSAAVARSESFQCDMVIGDRYGTSTDPAIPDRIEFILRGMGYSVARNRPYAGGFITEHYGSPRSGLHAIQIEINRGLYMDERKIERSRDFDRLKRNLTHLAEEIVAYAATFEWPDQLAAE